LQRWLSPVATNNNKERFNNSGKLNLNRRIKNASSPKFKGLVTIDSVSYWISAWQKPHPSTGTPYLSLNVIEQNTEGDPSHNYTKKGNGSLYTGQNGEVTGTITLDDDIHSVVGSFRNETIRFKLSEQEAVKYKEEVGSPYIIDLSKEQRETLTLLAGKYQLSDEAALNLLVKNFLEKIAAP